MSLREVLPVGSQLLQATGRRKTWSEAVSFRDFVWVSGQVGMDKTTGRLVEATGEEEAIESETVKALENLREALEAAGSSLGDVVLTRVYLLRHRNYKKYDAVYGRYFPSNPPARVTVVVKDLIGHSGLLPGPLIEIEAFAAKRSG